MLASRGVHVLKIQKLGRWESTLVAHYTGEALATGMAGDLGASQCVGGQELAFNQQFSGSVLDRLDRLEIRLDEGAEEEPSHNGSSGSFIVNESTLCLHRSWAQSSWPSHMQRTRCGWNYHWFRFTRLGNSLPTGANTPWEKVCCRCLPELRDKARSQQSPDAGVVDFLSDLD